jgi:hypothetical protein
MGEIEDDENTDTVEQNLAAYAKAEAIFRRGGSLRGLSIRTDHLSGRQRLSMGEDGEDGMATFCRLESAKRLLEDEG